MENITKINVGGVDYEVRKDLADKIVELQKQIQQGTGSGGTTDYTDLENKPQINEHELSGNQSSEDLGLQPAGDYALKSEIPDTSNFATKDELNNITPTIGENGNWFINGVDTGKPANGKDGADGVSLGEISLVQETGTESGSENKVMSQKAVSEKLTELGKDVNFVSGKIDGHVLNSSNCDGFLDKQMFQYKYNGTDSRTLYSTDGNIYVWDISKYIGETFVVTKNFQGFPTGANKSASITVQSKIPTKSNSNMNDDIIRVIDADIREDGSYFTVEEGDLYLVISSTGEGELTSRESVKNDIEEIKSSIETIQENFSAINYRLNETKSEKGSNYTDYYYNVESVEYLYIKSNIASTTNYSLNISLYEDSEYTTPLIDDSRLFQKVGGGEYDIILKIPSEAKTAKIRANFSPSIEVYGIPYYFIPTDVNHIYRYATSENGYFSLKNDLGLSQNNLIEPFEDTTLVSILPTGLVSSQFYDYELGTFIAGAPQGGGKWTGDGTYCSIVNIDGIGKCIEITCKSDSVSGGYLLISKDYLKNLGITNGDIVRIGAYCVAINTMSERYIQIGHSMIHVENTESPSPQWVEFTTSLDVFNEQNVVISLSCVNGDSFYFGKFCIKKETSDNPWIGYEEYNAEDDNTESSGFNNPFSGKKLATICDSLGMNVTNIQTWQSRLCKLLGMNFMSEANQETSVGGTTSLTELDTCGQSRCLKLAQYDTPDVILLENINDHSFAGLSGSIEDEPYMLSEFVDYDTQKSSKTEALSYFKENIESIVSTFTKKVGTMVRLQYTTNSVKFQVTKAPSSSGTINIKVGERIYGIEVTESMTELKLMQEIRNYSYEGLKLSGHSDSSYYCVFTVEDDGIGTPTVDVANTGAEVQVTTSSAPAKFGMCFHSHDVSNWINVSYWKEINELGIYAVYKGMLEYLMTTYPKAWIFWWLPECFQLNWSNMTSFKRADGSLDIDAYKKSGENRYEKQTEIIIEICRYYGVPYIDIYHNGSYNIYNGSTFFNANNVHANMVNEGAQRWAEAMWRGMIGGA